MLTSLALGLPFRDSQCGLKAFRADVARRLFALRTIDGFGFDFEILTAALHNGFRVQRFPVRLTHNDDSRIALVRDSLRMARDLWRVRQRLNAGLYRTVTGEGDARPCPLCGDVDHTPQVAGHGYRMVACASCGLWYLNPMPTAAALARLYEESYFTSAVATTTGLRRLRRHGRRRARHVSSPTRPGRPSRRQRAHPRRRRRIRLPRRGCRRTLPRALGRRTLGERRRARAAAGPGRRRHLGAGGDPRALLRRRQHAGLPRALSRPARRARQDARRAASRAARSSR